MSLNPKVDDGKESTPPTPIDAAIHEVSEGSNDFHRADPILFGSMKREMSRQRHIIPLVASASYTHPLVLSCLNTALMNVTAEGYPGRRFHAGCVYVDEIENLAISRAKELFGA